METGEREYGVWGRCLWSVGMDGTSPRDGRYQHTVATVVLAAATMKKAYEKEETEAGRKEPTGTTREKGQKKRRHRDRDWSVCALNSSQLAYSFFLMSLIREEITITDSEREKERQKTRVPGVWGIYLGMEMEMEIS